MLLECLMIASTSAPAQEARPESPRTLPGEQRSAAIRVEPKEGSGLLVITSPLLAGESFTFVTCEALILDKKASDLFPLKLAVEDWKSAAGRWSYTWEFDGKLRLDFSATPQGESVRLEYRLTNGSNEALKNVAIFPCLPSLGAPSFYPGSADEAKRDPGGRRARVGRHDFSELYARLSLFADGKAFSFTDSSLASSEKHLAFMRKDEEPLEWSWFVNAERRFDVPLLVESSTDRKYVIGLYFDHGVQASSNVGDGRACMHVVPRFQEIPAGKSVSTVGRFYWMRATPEELLAQNRKDFPKLARD
jgi:hypothetical protein